MFDSYIQFIYLFEDKMLLNVLVLFQMFASLFSSN